MSDRLIEIKLSQVPVTAQQWNQEVFSKISKYLRIIDDQLFMAQGVVLPDGTIITQYLADGAVTNDKFRDSIALSVVGRPQGTPGIVSDIAAANDGELLSRRAGALVFSALSDGDIPATIARDAEVVAAINAHVALADPHPGYVLESSILNGSVTYDPPNLADGDGTTTTVTVTGAALGDFALASFSLDLEGITVSAYVSAPNTVAVRFQNESGGVLDLSSGTLRARVWQ